ncbi:hypothetical protein CU048_13095 [Beijerinckiaceae bacterium]|nr:hypothetical protein CU048_13095 [Beijerinckiaceae bacterium]
MIGRLLWQGFKGLCYAALVAIAGSLAICVILLLSGLCSRIDEGAAECKTPALNGIAYTFGMIPVLSSFTVVPFVLAICGLVFLVGHLIRRRHGSENRG